LADTPSHYLGIILMSWLPSNGFALLASGSVQEVMDIAGVAHLTAIKSRILSCIS
jgi:pyruvate/2-oxoacid:ferredoxin oxidoreductase alpha subunit